MLKLAYFISYHGFGHATRAGAVMAAIRQVAPAVHFEIFTQAPGWLFQEVLGGDFSLHPVMTDVGVVQRGPLRENWPLTLQRLDAFLPFDLELIADLSRKIKALGCSLVVCDIAPLGLAVARLAGRPSVLVENFTWDWVYGGYAEQEPRLKPHIDYLQEVFASADYHIQTEPAFRKASADLVTQPVSRPPRLNREETRARLGLPVEAPLVLITMGGIPDRYGFLSRLIELRRLYFVIPGGSETISRRNNLVLIPHRSEFFHPDLVNACDAVVGKAGYSTIAEVYQTGLPFGYVPRERFRETAVLKAFLQSEMPAIEISEAEFKAGAWAARLPELLALPRRPHPTANGAAQAAEFIFRIAQAHEDVICAQKRRHPGGAGA